MYNVSEIALLCSGEVFGELPDAGIVKIWGFGDLRRRPCHRMMTYYLPTGSPLSAHLTRRATEVPHFVLDCASYIYLNFHVASFIICKNLGVYQIIL